VVIFLHFFVPLVLGTGDGCKASRFPPAKAGAAQSFSVGNLVFLHLNLSRLMPRDPRRQCQPRNAVEDASKQVPRHRHLSQLEHDILGVPRHLGSDLDELLPQRRQRSVSHRFRQDQPPQKVAQVVGQLVCDGYWVHVPALT